MFTKPHITSEIQDAAMSHWCQNATSLCMHTGKCIFNLFLKLNFLFERSLPNNTLTFKFPQFY